jgi:hypothetical protein
MSTDCSICLEIINEKNTCTTNCGHIFHLDCIIKNNKFTCPLCRNPISSTSEGTGINQEEEEESEDDDQEEEEESEDDDQEEEEESEDDDVYNYQDVTSPPQYIVDVCSGMSSEHSWSMEKVRSALINAARKTTGYDRRTAVLGHWDSWSDTAARELVLVELESNFSSDEESNDESVKEELRRARQIVVMKQLEKVV